MNIQTFHRFFMRSLFCAYALLVAVMASETQPGEAAVKGRFSQPDKKGMPGLYVWTDLCNVYVLREGDTALLVDLGDGSVLEHLGEIGVHSVEWVLFTHHHREQCQGYGRLKGWHPKIGVPDAELTLFEHPNDFRKMHPSLADPFTVYGSSYVRPPIESVTVDRSFQGMDMFRWRGHQFWCVDTRGNSPGGMSYLYKTQDRWRAFSGDVMLAGARLHNWFDSEWDYGFGAGIYALARSAATLRNLDPEILLPAHGDMIREPIKTLGDFDGKLRRLEKLYLRGYELNTFAEASQDPVSRPTLVTDLWQISPHLFKFKGINSWPNFGLILSDSGRALVVDCGLLDVGYLDRALEGMKSQFGLKSVDAVVITHMHGDHFLEVPHLQKKWGASVWGLECMQGPCETPERYDYAASINAYGREFSAIHFDRLFKSGETFAWEGFVFTVDWMPGQTEFALCLHGRIDGRTVAFTGDNILGNPRDSRQSGHEAVVAHNGSVLEEGYIYGSQYLLELKPDLLVGGHSWVMDQPGALLKRYHRWSLDMRSAFKDLLCTEDYRYGYDPFWVRAEPYRTRIGPAGDQTVRVHLRNFKKTPQVHRIEFHSPQGIKVEPAVITGQLPGQSRGQWPIRIHAETSASQGVQMIAMDVTTDGHRYGEWFDFVVQVDGAQSGGVDSK